MPEQELVWAIDEHTRAKHRILKRYLQAWLPIMSSQATRLVVVDGFAGPGVYKGGEPGSPIIELCAFLEHKRKAQVTAQLMFVFVEENEKRANHLEGEIAKLGELPDQVRARVVCAQYEQTFASVLDALNKGGGTLAPTFAFIDPFGYTQASMHLSGRFLQFDRCEVLVYAPLRWVNRFLARTDQAGPLTSFFGTEDWREGLYLQGDERIRFLHDLFYRQLKKQVRWVRSFEIVSAEGTGYHLFFGTDSTKGLLRMKEALWKDDPVAGQGFRDSTALGLAPLFVLDPDLGPLREAIIGHFGNRVFTIEQLEHFTIVDTPYLPTHLRKPILIPLESEKKLVIVDAKSNRRPSTYAAGTRMQLKL